MEIRLETYSGKYNEIINELNKKRIRAIVKSNKLIIFTPNAEETLDYVMNLLKNKKGKLMNVIIDKPTLNEVFENVTKQR